MGDEAYKGRSQGMGSMDGPVHARRARIDLLHVASAGLWRAVTDFPYRWILIFKIWRWRRSEPFSRAATLVATEPQHNANHCLFFCTTRCLTPNALATSLELTRCS